MKIASPRRKRTLSFPVFQTLYVVLLLVLSDKNHNYILTLSPI